MTDAGCRTTVFNAAAQSGIEYAREMRQAGVRHFRVEMLRESAEEMKRLLECCGGVLHGSEEGRAAWRQLQAISRSPVTRGTFK
jgi:putative protease